MLGAGAVYRFGVAVTRGRDYRPHRLAITPTISQATPDSFLPRWGKKPFRLAVYEGGQPSIRASPVQGKVAARRADGRVVLGEGSYVQSLSSYGAAPFAQGSLHWWLLPPFDRLTYGNVLFSWLAAHGISGLGMQRNQLQRPPAGPHRDDRERRQIPVPFFGAA